MERAIFSFIQRHKKPRIAIIILNDKRPTGNVTIPNLKLYYRAIVIKKKQNKKQPGISMKTDMFDCYVRMY